MDAVTSLSFNLSNVQINDPLEKSLSMLLGSNHFNKPGLLPSVFTPELQGQWKTIIEPALLKGLKDTNLHTLLLETIHELAKRKYDLNRQILDPIDPICPHTNIARHLLYLACAKGADCFHIMYEMMKMENINVNATTSHGATLFRLAVLEGHLELIELLLNDPRIDPNKCCVNCESPFYTACFFANFQVIDRLLKDQRINPNLAIDSGETAFYIACQNGQTEVVKSLLRNERVDPNQNRNDGWFPFLVACDKGHIEIIKILLANPRVDLTKTLPGGWSAFFYVNDDNIGILELLLSDVRLDPNKASEAGITPLAYACIHKNPDVVNKFLSCERVDPNLHTHPIPSALIQSIKAKKCDSLKILLKNPRVQIIDSDQMYQAFDSLVTDNCKDGAEIILALSSKRPDLEEASIRLTNHVESKIKNLNAHNTCEQLVVDYAKDPVLRQKISLALYAKHFGVEESANLFAAIVLTCDDFLAFKANVEAQNWFRYMQIATRLPLELQMVLANRTWGIGKDLVTKKDLEHALREVLKIFKILF